MLIKHTHRKAEETLEINLSQPRQTFLFTPPPSFEGSWMIGLISVEVYKSIFNINYQNNKIEFYTDTFNEISFEELKGELEEIFNISKIPHDEHLQDEILGPRTKSAYKK